MILTFQVQLYNANDFNIYLLPFSYE